MKKNSTPYLTIAIILCLVTFSVISLAEDAKKLVTYNYSAKRVISGNKSGVTILKGDAKFIKIDPDSKENGDYVYADQITIYRDPETKKTTRMEAMGKVKMKEGDMVATCERAVLRYEPEDIIEMEGSPAIVDQGDNKIEAPIIKYYRNDDRLEAEAGEGNVTGRITVEEKEAEGNKSETSK
ncbi:TPA: hypothetical protein ENS27_15260 [bacterium]|jgi:lipopolysaccharide export system protein LptA|nr:hypothetical protein [bacterium]